MYFRCWGSYLLDVTKYSKITLLLNISGQSFYSEKDEYFGDNLSCNSSLLHEITEITSLKVLQAIKLHFFLH